MHRPPRVSGGETPSPPATRSQSVASIASIASSDRTSLGRFATISTPPLARRPEPAYVAASAASQIVTNDQDPHALDLDAPADDMTGSPEPALVTQASLKLVNDFLDHLLYNFLGVARSTSFVALRPAIHEVLRPTLAAEAIAGADQELQEYLGAGLEGELASSAAADAADSSRVWDLETVWRRARLRCMVYSSLGDLEEDDEGSFLLEDLQHATDVNGRRPDEVEAVSPAVAIFLASILEFMGEQILLLAAQAAAQRMQSRKPDLASPGASPRAPEPIERLVVDELDTEKVALHPTFGRLWRTWRKRVRSPSASFSRSMSRDSVLARRPYHAPTGSSRRSSVDTLDGPTTLHEQSRPTSLSEVPEEDLTLAANIALPMSENDVEEIEVPGVVDLRGHLRDRLNRHHDKRRPRSLAIPSPVTDHHHDDGPTSATSQSSSSTTLPSSPKARRTRLERARSNSLPTPVRSPLHVRPDHLTDDGTFFTPLQSPQQDQPSRSDSSLNRPEEKTLTPRANSSSGGEVAREPLPHEARERTRNALATSEGLVSHETGDLAATAQAPQAPSEDHRAGMSHPFSGPGDVPPSERSIRSRGDAVGLATVSIHQPATGGPTHSRTGRASGSSRTVTDNPQYTPATGSAASSNRVDASQTRAPLERLILDGTDDGDEVAEPDTADPDAIGVAHTTNVPLPAPLSSPSIRKNSRPEEDRSVSPRGVPYAREEVVEERGSSRSGNTDHRRLRYDFVSEDQDTLDRSPKSSRGTPIHPTSTAYKDATSASSRATGAMSPRQPLEELTEDLLEGLEEDDPADVSYDRARSDSAVLPSSFVNGHSSSQVESPTSPTRSVQKKRSSGSRASDHRDPALSTASGSSADRASVQRVFTPPMTPRDDSLPRAKRSDSINKGSTSPQLATRVKSVLSRHQDEPHKAGGTSRSSQEDSGRRESTTRSSAGEPRSREAERSFEQLIHSDETIQYTLTPPNMRDMDGNVRRADVVEGSGYVKRTTLSDSSSRHSRQQSISSRSVVGSQAEPPSARSTKFPSTSPEAVVGSSSTRPAEGRYIPNSGRSPEAIRMRPGGAVARDARTDRTSTKYFADFIRSTGPTADENEPPRRLASPPPQISSSGGVVPLPAGVINGSRTSVAKSIRSSSGPRAATRPQPREEKPFGREDSSALVDFIRQGPPDEKQPISKAIAPFRTTLDQDDLATLTNGQPIESMTTQSTASTRNGSSMSQAPSYDSRTALLDRSGASGSVTAQIIDDAPPIKRKQRRVRDPYAIDTDSEEEMVPRGPPGKAPRQSEAIMEFLRDVEPDPSKPGALPSAFDGIPKPAGSGKTAIRRDPAGTVKGGSSSHMVSVPQVTINPPSTDPTPPATSSHVRSGPPQVSFSSADRDDSFLGLNKSLGISSTSSSGPVEGSSVTAPSSMIPPSSSFAGPPVTNRFNPGRTAAPAVRSAPRVRQAKTDREDTSDLADFLRSSGPPPPPPVRTASPRPAKEEGGFSKLFRKKKSAAVV
ncbi:MAG: hypothetical protein M1823_000626 [Watsoniomyces obsoletus]|nr:MAG: hypothetical protein M1823_000626 [Watsoniomyces obsoletus]